jgi:hypothetical protein
MEADAKPAPTVADCIRCRLVNSIEKEVQSQTRKITDLVGWIKRTTTPTLDVGCKCRSDTDRVAWEFSSIRRLEGGTIYARTNVIGTVNSESEQTFLPHILAR